MIFHHRGAFLSAWCITIIAIYLLCGYWPPGARVPGQLPSDPPAPSPLGRRRVSVHFPRRTAALELGPHPPGALVLEGLGLGPLRQPHGPHFIRARAARAGCGLASRSRAGGRCACAFRRPPPCTHPRVPGVLLGCVGVQVPIRWASPGLTSAMCNAQSSKEAPARHSFRTVQVIVGGPAYGISSLAQPTEEPLASACECNRFAQ